LHLKKHLSHNLEDSISFHSSLSGSFKSNYNLFRRFKERKEIFVKKTTRFVPKGKNILDLGCGPGVITSALAENGYNLTGVDGSSEMLILARGNVNSNGDALFLQKKIPFNFEELNRQYDAIVSSSLLEYLDEYDKTIKLIKELLYSDGIFIASIPNKRSLYRKIERLIFLLIGKPLYLKFAKNHFTMTEFTSSVTDRGFVCLDFDYFAIKGPLFRFLDRFLPSKYTNNMLICIFRKE
jgi:2-polyprenyl-3-methyl-5-hydroxy-6-metoxy-1,4-benzoquinol methylase